MKHVELDQKIMKYTYGQPIETDAVVLGNIKVGENLSYLALEGKSFKYKLKKDIPVYGLGESVRGINKRGWIYESFCSDDDMHTETKRSLYAAHNFIIIAEEKPFGLFIDYPGRLTFDIGYSQLDELVITPENMDLDLYILEGDTLLDIVKTFRQLAGASYIPPRWAFGYQQSRWSYKTNEEVRAVAKGFRDNGIPLDSIYLDIDYMERLKDFTIDREKFPDFEELVAELKEDGIRLIPIIDAGVKVEEDYNIYEEGVAGDFFVRDEKGDIFEGAVWPGKVHFPDFLNSKAREWFGQHYAYLMDKGIDGFWNDMNEPAIFYTPRAMAQAMHKVEESKDKNIDLGTFFGIKDSFSQIMNKEEYFKEMHHNMDGKCVRHYDVHNLYGYNMTRAAGEAFEKLRPSERVLLFSRASYVGMHRYGGIWTGDNRSWWSHLLLNIKMMPSLNMCGFLYSGADVGGFSDNTTEDLLTRWIQFGIFMPLLRNHTAAWTRQQEPYAFEHTERLKKWIKLRYALIPHLYSEYMKAALEGGMYFKPLAFEYEDEYVREMEDQLLVGESLMIAPVYEQNKTGRYVYLPEDMLLVTFEDEKTYTLTKMAKGHHYVACDMDHLILFVRPGRMLLLGAAADSTKDLDMTSLTGIAYCKEVCHHTYYEDNGMDRQVHLEGHVTEVEIKKENNHFNIKLKNAPCSVLKKLALTLFDNETETITGIQYDI